MRSSPRGDVLSTKMLVPSLPHRLGLRAFNMLVTVFQIGTRSWLVLSSAALCLAPLYSSRTPGRSTHQPRPRDPALARTYSLGSRNCGFLL